MGDSELTDWASLITPPDEAARTAARARQDRLTKPAGSLGRLEEVGTWLAGVCDACPPPAITAPALAIFAGDHAIAGRTSAYPPEVTAQMVANMVTGGAAATVLARSRGVTVRVVDAGVDVDWAASGLPVPAEVTVRRVRRGAGPIDQQDAMTGEECRAALRLGADVADELIDAGADLLLTGDMGIGNSTPSAVLVGLLADQSPTQVVGRGTGIDDLTWMAKTAVVRDAMRRGRRVAGDPVELLACVAGPDLAAMTGYLLQAAARRTPVLLDGVVSCACALVAHRIAFRASGWWAASHLSTEPAAAAALARLGLEPLLDLQLRLGEGTGALLALPLVQASGDLLREMATFGSAGVSDRTPGSAELDAAPRAVDAGASAASAAGSGPRKNAHDPASPSVERTSVPAVQVDPALDDSESARPDGPAAR